MATVNTFLLSILLLPIHQATSPLPISSSSPTYPMSSKCSPPKHVLSPNLTCVQTKDTGSQKQSTEQLIQQDIDLDNSSKEMEMTDGWNNSIINQDTSYFCVENITSNSSNPDWLAHLNILNVYTAAGVVSLISLFIVFVVYWYVPHFNTLHGRIVLSNVLSITFVTIILITVYNGSTILS